MSIAALRQAVGADQDIYDKLVSALDNLQQAQHDTNETIKTLVECVRLLSDRVERLEQS